MSSSHSTSDAAAAAAKAPDIFEQRLKETGGTFKRKDAHFRDVISDDPGAKFPAEAARYHLCASLWRRRV
jgi:glutathionyl-hydroquinone reductase